MMKEMKGVCFLFSETGTEGGWWAIQQDGFVDDDGDWRYEGMELLEEGDDFTVFDDDGSVLWQGIIHRDLETGRIPRQVFRNGRLVYDRTWTQQAVGGMWVHWVQKDMDSQAWGKLFVGEKRCLLRREEPTAKDALLQRLRHEPALDVARLTEEDLYERQQGAGIAKRKTEQHRQNLE